MLLLVHCKPEEKSHSGAHEGVTEKQSKWKEVATNLTHRRIVWISFWWQNRLTRAYHIILIINRGLCLVYHVPDLFLLILSDPSFSVPSPLCRSEQLQCRRPSPSWCKPCKLFMFILELMNLVSVINQKPAFTRTALLHITKVVTRDLSVLIPLMRNTPSPDFTSPRGATWSQLFETKEWDNCRFRKRFSPVFSRCRRTGCSRFPPSCSGTRATSVCCSFPGLGSFLRPRSEASWAPRIGKRRVTGTYFTSGLTRRREAEDPELRRPKSYSPRGQQWEWFGQIMMAWPRRITAEYLQCSSDRSSDLRLLPGNTAGGAVGARTRPPDTVIKRRATSSSFSLVR